MAYKRKYRRSVRKRGYAKKRTYSSSTKRKGSIKKLIRREIARNTENKIKDYEIPEVDISNTIDDTSIRYLIPAVAQGTTQSTRIGNSIRVKKFTLRLSINQLNLGANVSPSYIDIYIFKPKFQNYWAGNVSAADMTQFLQNDSSSEPYNGQVLDGLRYVNTDMFTLCVKRRITLFNPYSTQATYATTSSINPNRNLYFDLTKHVKKRLLFEDGVSAVTNDNLCIAIGATQTDASTYFGYVAKYQGIVQMTYEDA